MSLVKRGKTWHTHFFIDGQRFRQSLDTGDWREAQKREKELISQASQGKLAAGSQQFSKLSFEEAAERNLAERIARLAPRSVQTERERLKPLVRSVRLNQGESHHCRDGADLYGRSEGCQRRE